MVTISKAAQELGRKGGQAKSPAKTAAARANAKKPRTRRNKMDDLHKAVDEVAACIETARSVAGQVQREIESALAFDVEHTDNQARALGFAIGTLKNIRNMVRDLQSEADKAQAAVKYLGAKE